MVETKYKSLRLFFLASSALIAAGYLINNNTDFVTLIILFFYNLTGVFFVYRINDSIDQHLELKFRIIQFFRQPVHALLLVCFIVSLFFTLPFMTYFSFLILAISGFIGLLYSITFTFRGTKYRLKNIFLFKNVFIGICWGSLILIGAGNGSNSDVWMLFAFTSVQVMIGSIIRDFPDMEKDKQMDVHTMPLVMGTKQTFIYMHFLNLASLGFIYLTDNWEKYEILFFSIILFRGITLIKTSYDIHSRLWSQLMNLMTCILILFVIVIEKLIL